MNALPQGVGIQASDNASQAVSAAQRATQPGLPELRCPGHFQSVQAPEPGPMHGENRFYGEGSGNPGERAVIRHVIDHLAREVEDLFRVTDQAGERPYSFRSFKRFHSKSESSSINCSISWWFLTASRMRPSHCRGTNSWRNFPPCRRTKYS